MLAEYKKTLTLLKPTGIYTVGTKAIEMKDSSRTMFRGSNPRRWMIQAFYPAEKHVGVYSYMPETIEDGIVLGTKIFSHAKFNADMLKSHKFPVIIFVPGLGAERQKYTILCEELASNGYVVLSFDQPYVTHFVKFFDGTRVVYTLKDLWHWTLQKNHEFLYQFCDDAITGSMKDVEYFLDNLIDVNLKELGDICDLNKIIQMGHSIGGNVAYIQGLLDHRIKAVINLDGDPRMIEQRISLVIQSTKKPILCIRSIQAPVEDPAVDLAETSNVITWAPNVEHCAFGDSAYFANKIQVFESPGRVSSVMSWLFKKGPTWSNAATNLGGRDADSWFAEYLDFVVQWLKANAR